VHHRHDGARTRCEEEAREHLVPTLQARDVLAAEPVGDEWPAARACAHASARVILDHEAEQRRVIDRLHELHEALAEHRHGGRGELERRCAALEEDALVVELLDAVALRDRRERLHRLVEPGPCRWCAA